MVAKMVQGTVYAVSFWRSFLPPFPKIDFLMNFGYPLAPFWLPLATFWLPLAVFGYPFGALLLTPRLNFPIFGAQVVFLLMHRYNDTTIQRYSDTAIQRYSDTIRC